MLTVLKILTLFLTMLTAAPGLAHLFELPNKIGLPRDAYFTVQGIYAGWALFGVVIMAAIAANLFLAWKLRQYNRGSSKFAVCSAALIAVSLGIFFTWTLPANQATLNWTTIPEDWERLRTAWEYSHAVNALINTAAFLATAVAITSETPPPSR
jgi:membrane protease YdiL (CAAX protease family)